MRICAFELGLAVFLAFSGAGCGSSGGSGTGGSGGSGGSGTGGSGGTGGSTTGTTGGATTGGTGGMAAMMVLTSPDFTEGGVFPADDTCAGKNLSPKLDWTAGPAGTKSYSVVLQDENNNLIHSAIWDIPGDALGLPANVEKTQKPANVPGAKQAKAYDNTTYGYLGPCPNGNLHTYKFTVTALDVAVLPVVGFPTKETIADVSLEHKLAAATLSGKSDAKP